MPVRNTNVASKPDADSLSICVATFRPLQCEVRVWSLCLSRDLFRSHLRVGPYVDGSVLARVFFVILAGRCSHMFGLLMRHIARPLAIMLSAKPGPGQKHAFKDAVAQMGCPDRRVDRLSHYMQLPFPNLLART